MSAVMNGFMRGMDVVNVGVRWALAAMLAVMTILIAWQVFARFVIGDSLSFSEEISRFLMVWLVLLGSAYAARNGRLMKVDILETVVPGRFRPAVLILAGAVSILFYLVLVVFGFMIVEAVSYQSTPATQISMSIPMAALPVGGIFLVLNTLYNLSAVVLGKEEVSEIDELVEDAKGDAAEVDPQSLITQPPGDPEGPPSTTTKGDDRS